MSASRSAQTARDGSTSPRYSFGGVRVQHTFYARGQTGQQLLLGAYQALSRQIDAGNVTMHARTDYRAPPPGCS